MTVQGRLVAAEPSCAAPAVARPAAPVPGRLTGPAALLALQRQAGNRAVTALLASSPRDTSGPGGPALATVQRIPSYAPNPSWSTKGADQNLFACVPFAPGEAQVQWELWSTIFPAEAGSRCGCSRVTDVWKTYFAATGGRYRFDTAGDCVHDQLAGDDVAHQMVEERMLTQIEAAVPRLVATMAGTPTKTFSFTEVGVNTSVVGTSLVYNVNTLAGGSLFGGIGDSEYGPDTRHADGEVQIDLTPDPRNRMYVSARPRVTFHYSITDGVDFCPGNTGEPSSSWILEGTLTAVSRIEASGMARDVFVGANYDRVRYLPPQDQPNPDLVHPVNPQPRHLSVTDPPAAGGEEHPAP